MFSPLEQFDVKPLFFFTIQKLQIDLSFFDIFIPVIIIIITFLSREWILEIITIMPTSYQKILEEIIEFVIDIIRKQINNEVLKYTPIILVIFIMLTLVNIISIFPMGISLTSHLISLLWVSILIGIACFLYGFWIKNVEFLKIFVPNCPLMLLPILIIIELFSYLIRCFSLAIRLAANMLAGHTLIMIIIVFLINVVVISYLIGMIGIIFLISILMLEIGVCFLQAYVLTILLCIYMNDIYKEGH